MAEIVMPPQAQNLTLPVLTELTTKLDKQPQVTERAISEDEPSTPEERVLTNSIVSGTTTIVCDHTPVRSVLHKEAVHLRQDLQLHLRSVMKTGDDMLVKIRAIIEELDTAVHERQLAVEELEDITIKRDQLRLQFESVTKECIVLRTRLLEMSKARDRAEIDLEACKGLLLEKEEECNELKRESSRLHIQITELSHKLLEYTSRLSEAEGKVRWYISEVSKLKIEIESLKVEIKTQIDINISLGKELSHARFEYKDIKLELEKVRHELISATTRLSTITIELVNIKEELRIAIISKETAEKEREQAIKDRDAAVIIAEDAATKRDDAIRSRDQAIFTEQQTNIKWVRDSALLEDCQRSLIAIRKTVEIITIERNTAIHNCDNFEHLRDEALENFREADAERHRLKRELGKAHRDVKDIELRIEIEIGKTRDVIYEKEVIIKEKEMIESKIVGLEREKNAAIAKEAKALEEWREIDKKRDFANKKWEKMEDKFQQCSKLLAVAEEKRESALGREKNAQLQVQLAEEKLAKSVESEASLVKERDAVKVTLASTTKDLESEKAKTVQSAKDLVTANNTIQELKNRYVLPATEKDGCIIKQVIFGSSTVNKASVYQAILNSRNGESFTPNSSFFGDSNVDQKGVRYAGIFYALKNKQGKFIDQLPIWYGESNSPVNFKPVANPV